MSDLRDKFNRFDTDGDGFIEVAELDGLLRALGSSAMSDAAVRQVLARLKTAEPGKVTFEEFRPWWEEFGASTIKTAKVRPFHDPD